MTPSVSDSEKNLDDQYDLSDEQLEELFRRKNLPIVPKTNEKGQAILPLDEPKEYHPNPEGGRR